MHIAYRSIPKLTTPVGRNQPRVYKPAGSLIHPSLPQCRAGIDNWSSWYDHLSNYVYYDRSINMIAYYLQGKS